MKKIIIFLMTLALCLTFSFPVFADEEDEPESETTTQEQTTVDSSQPRLMITDYELSSDSLSPSETSELKITFKNFSSSKAVNNIKLSISDESGDISATGMPTKYVNCIYAGSTYVWTVELTASKIAKTGEHKLSVTAEYEDKYYNAYSSGDVISLNIRQTPDVAYNGIQLPSKLVQGDTQSITVKLMNTGKTVLRNCRVDFKIDGLSTSGALFIGEIPEAESKEGTANLRVDKDALGEVKGTATVYYEDEFGETFTQTADISTVIEKKVEVAEKPEEEKKENKNPLWWLFLAGGLAAGGAAGFAIPTAVRSKKQRKEDELRL